MAVQVPVIEYGKGLDSVTVWLGFKVNVAVVYKFEKFYPLKINPNPRSIINMLNITFTIIFYLFYLFCFLFF